MIRIFSALLAAIVLSYSAAAQEAAPSCIPVDVFTVMISRMSDYSNLRLVPRDKIVTAIETYNALPPGKPSGDWTFAMLVDGPKGTGALVVGRKTEVCEFAALNAALYGKIVRLLEGDRI